MRRTKQILPTLEVSLGSLGDFTLDFSEVHIEEADLSLAMSQQPSIYAWYSAIEEELTKKLKLLKIEYDMWYGQKRMDLANTATSKLTVKDLDAMMDSDEKGTSMRREIVDVESQIDRIKGYLVALGMRHSVLLELSERERWGWSSTKGEESVNPSIIGRKYRKGTSDED